MAATPLTAHISTNYSSISPRPRLRLDRLFVGVRLRIHHPPTTTSSNTSRKPLVRASSNPQKGGGGGGANADEDKATFVSQEDLRYLAKLGVGSVGGAAAIKYGSIIFPDFTRPNLAQALFMVSAPVVVAVLLLIKQSTDKMSS